jgi:DNA replication protein DnaC
VKPKTSLPITEAALDTHLEQLRLPFIRENARAFASQAADKQIGHLDYLSRLIEGEACQRADRRVARLIKEARFPVTKTLDTFRWDWPKKIERMLIQDIFRLQFIQDRSNVILLGTVGLGKTHLASALGHAACQQGHGVLFANAIDVINTLHAAQTRGALKAELRKYGRPEMLILDEVGYLPIDQHGADLLFQVISARYEQGSIVLTSNKAYKDWSSIFNGDATITSAVLDRLLHHCQTVVIEGNSYRMKDRIEH